LKLNFAENPKGHLHILSFEECRKA